MVQKPYIMCGMVERWKSRKSRGAVFFVAVFFATGLFVVAPNVSASPGGFYAGVSAGLERIDPVFSKDVINSALSVAVPRRGMTFSDRGSEDETTHSWGALIGYRFPLGETLYLGCELDFAFHSGSARGRLAGAGMTPTRNFLGESWPDSWSFGKEESYGVTLKLGASPEWLRALAGESSVYALAGARVVRTRLAVSFDGCPTLEDGNNACPAGTARLTGTEVRRRRMKAWTAGAGLEKKITANTALQAEVYYHDYEDEDWIAFDLNGVLVPQELSSEDTGLALRWVWFF